MTTPSQMLIKRSTAHIPVRLAILGACVGWFTSKMLGPLLLPFGPPRPYPFIPTYAEIDTTNDLLMEKHGKITKIYERLEDGQSPLMKGPETIFFDDYGTMYSATEEGNLISFTDIQTNERDGKTTAKVTLVKDLGPGRPLGAKFLGDTLYVADAALGLTRVTNVLDPKSKVEIVATGVMDGGNWTRIMYADDVAVSPKTGMVYFTDATEIYSERGRDMLWDTMYASKLEFMRGPSGRLLQYDPSTDQVTVLMRELMFANGVAVGDGEDYVVVVETFRSRMTKYYVQGEKKGTTEIILDGYPSPAWHDGMDCAWKGVTAESSYCYAVGITPVLPLAKILYKLPYPLDIILRMLLMTVPKQFTPKVAPYANVEIVNPETREYVGILQDPYGKDVSVLTGVTVHNNKLYLGSLHNNYIAVYDLA